MEIPKNLLYTKTHEWVELLEGGSARMGITQHAADAMGDLVFVELPEVGDEFEVGESLAVVESVKAVSDVYAPVSGKVSAVNESLLDDPAQINGGSFDAWLVEFSGVQHKDLLNSEEYEAVLSEEE